MGHRDKMMSIRTDGYSAPRGGEIQEVVDLLHLSSAVSPAQALLQLCVRVGALKAWLFTRSSTIATVSAGSLPTQ